MRCGVDECWRVGVESGQNGIFMACFGVPRAEVAMQDVNPLIGESGIESRMDQSIDTNVDSSNGADSKNSLTDQEPMRTKLHKKNFIEGPPIGRPIRHSNGRLIASKRRFSYLQPTLSSKLKSKSDEIHATDSGVGSRTTSNDSTLQKNNSHPIALLPLKSAGLVMNHHRCSLPEVCSSAGVEEVKGVLARRTSIPPAELISLNIFGRALKRFYSRVHSNADVTTASSTKSIVVPWK